MRKKSRFSGREVAVPNPITLRYVNPASPIRLPALYVKISMKFYIQMQSIDKPIAN